MLLSLAKQIIASYNKQFLLRRTNRSASFSASFKNRSNCESLLFRISVINIHI